MIMAGEGVELNSKSEGDNGGNLTRTRIYVGGLGGTVTEDDLRKTFSPLGKLESVEIVRTKNRSFAYLDFLPSSDKSLVKLFSTYNGCIWKGGRLKLEKAKEHYLVRLKREWIEEAQSTSNAPTSNADVSENTGSFEKPKKVPAQEIPQLRFFFPKLMKMKSLPFTGTGKHKYSFQRVQVPSLPVHFCDCEEHSDPSNPSDTIKENPFVDLETEHGGINEKELDMMNSVMNKLFEKENRPKITGGEARLAKGSTLSTSSDDIHVDENENTNEADDGSDEDNLVINIVAGGNDKVTSLEKKEKIMGYQESNFNIPQASKQRAAKKTHEHEKKITPYDKKRKSPLIEESEGNENPSFTPKKKIISKTPSSEPEDQATSTQQSTHDISWSQKRGWKNLVGNRENTQFSISQILPDVPVLKEEQPKNNNLVVSNSTEIKEEKLLKHGNSDTQVGPLNEVNEPEINNDGNLESQSGPSKEMKKLTEAAPVVPSAVPSTSGRGAAWKQKSSWTQLISNTTASSFSISQVLPGLTFESQRVAEVPNVKNSEEHNRLGPERSDLKGDSSRTLELANNNLIITDPCGSNVNMSTKKEKKVVGPDVEQSSSEKKLANGGEIWNGETCPFMRSEASLKEWMKTKAALSGSLKKKANEK